MSVPEGLDVEVLGAAARDGVCLDILDLALPVFAQGHGPYAACQTLRLTQY